MKELLLEFFDQAFTAPSWHGTPLRGSLRGVTAREALRTRNSVHSSAISRQVFGGKVIVN